MDPAEPPDVNTCVESPAVDPTTMVESPTNVRPLTSKLDIGGCVYSTKKRLFSEELKK